ncbi:rhamnan synthesis F family protein [Pseudochelatococcus sp. B33]
MTAAASAPPPLIFVHVHYPDIWEEMAREIAQAFGRPFGLVVTHNGQAPQARLQTPHLAHYQEIVVENRGRDVLPFLTALRADLPPYEIGLKLHTKRSPHRDDGAEWRRFVTGSLLACDPGPAADGKGPDTDGPSINGSSIDGPGFDGSSVDGPSAWTLLCDEPALGLIAPEGHLLPLLGRLALNERPMKTMLTTLGLDTPIAALEEGRFAASTMFWFRAEALAPFRSPALDGLFEAESSQLDGTAAHAAERLFAHVCERQGFVASAMEAVPLIRAAAAGRDGAPLDADALRALSKAAFGQASNPFSIPMAAFWSQHRQLLHLAHLTYRHIPPPLWRAARRLIRRYSSRE